MLLFLDILETNPNIYYNEVKGGSLQNRIQGGFM